MSEWMEGVLSDVAEIIMGQSPAGETCSTNDIGTPLLNGPTEFGIKYPKPVQFTNDPKKSCKKNDILFCVRGSTTGRMNWANQEYALGRGLAAIRSKNGEEYRYFIRGIIDYNLSLLLVAATGSTFPNVSRDQLAGLEIFVPPLEEQKAIASVLSSLDDKIDLLHRQNKTLEAMAETLFRQWFVEDAKEHWKEGCLEDIASFHNGKRPDSIINGGNIPIYGGNGVLGYSANYNYEGTTVIVGRVGAYCGSLYIEQNPIWVSDNALVAKPIKSKYSSFLFFLLKYLNLNEMAEGSSHPLLTQTLLKSIPIILPPPELIESFVSQVDIWLNKINSNDNQTQTLETLRDTLLPKLMSGAVRVAV